MRDLVWQVDGAPITSPSGWPAALPENGGPSTPAGAPMACVGDVVRVPVAVHSLMPHPLTLDHCHLSLSILQVPPPSPTPQLPRRSG